MGAWYILPKAVDSWLFYKDRLRKEVYRSQALILIYERIGRSICSKTFKLKVDKFFEV